MSRSAQRAARIALAAMLLLLAGIGVLSYRSLARLDEASAQTVRPEVADAISATMLALSGLIAAAVLGIVIALASDFAIRREVEERMRAEAVRRRLFEIASDMMAIKAPDGTREVNGAWLEGLGYSAEEGRTKPLQELVHPDEYEELRDRMANVRMGDKVGPCVNRLRTKSGEYKWIEWRTVVDAGGMLFSTMRDVTESRQDAQRLEALSQELARSNRELQEFATVASHDLQEPLRKIRTFGDKLAAKADTLDEQGRDYLMRMQSAATRMQRLIEDLLSFSRIAGRPPQPKRVDLATVAREVVADLEARVAETSARLEIGDLPAIQADPMQMRQLLQNLIGNALKFHAPGKAPVVKVTASVRADTCVLEVADEGIGFDEKYLDRIFAVFQRLHGRGEYEGTGMGLAICRRIAERHGGTIAARSKPGEGATFVVTLPREQAEASPS